jgi:drug/metabolite transporter (DMT)-like permease
VFVLVIGALAFAERTRLAQWLGAAVSLAGVLWVLIRGDPANLSRVVFVPGDLIMLAANLTWATYTWLLLKRRPKLPFASFLAVQMVFGVLAIAPFAAAEAALSPLRIDWSGTTWLALAYIAILPSIVAYYCWDRGVARVGAVVPVYFANLTPVFAAVLSLLLLDESPRGYHLAALALIIGGIHLASRNTSGGD